MDLPCLSWQDHVAQKWTGLETGLKEHFTSLLETDDAFQSALALTTQDDLDFLQSISEGWCVQKDTDRAASCREGGNCSFKAKDYTAAALHYSQGICFAPQSSEQLSMCYANRSAALCHLQRYQESLEDIDRALRSGYPSHLSRKLEDRRSLCLNHLSVEQGGDGAASENHKGSGEEEGPSAGAPGIDPRAAVEFSVEKGRHLVAVEGIAAGEVILTERPYSCVLIPGMKGGPLFGTQNRRCHRCLRESLCLLPCDGCSYARYCSTGCRKDAWEEHHRWECPLMGELMAMGVMARLAVRVTLKAGLRRIIEAKESTRDAKSVLTCSNDDSCDLSKQHFGASYLSVFHLLHHMERHSPAARFLHAVTAAALFLKFSKAGPPPASWGLGGPPGESSGSADVTDWGPELWPLGGAVLRHMLQLRCNAQAVVALQDTGVANSPVQSNQEVRVATAIFSNLSLLNHSCRPNTSLAFGPGDTGASDVSVDFGETRSECTSTTRGVTVTVRAARSLGPGEEILHCYGPHSSRMATEERQRLLQEQYYFLCGCEACAQPQQGRDEDREADRGGSQHPSRLLCAKCKGSLKDGGTEYACPQPSCGHRVSSDEVSLRLRGIRGDLGRAVDLMERDRPDEALRLLEKTRRRCDVALAETHPLQGELADAMARAHATMGDWNNAASHLERSAALIGSQYGEDSIEMARQLFKLAQLHFNGGARGPALSVIPKVRRLLRVHCGPHCQEIQELQAMEECLQG